MSTEIASLSERREYAAVMAQSDMLPPHLRGKPENLLWTMEVAQSLGLSLAQAVNGVVVINGTPSLKAETMRALVLAAGHHLVVSESSAERCVIDAARRGSEHVQRSEFTMADAKTAGLGGNNWVRYPKSMLLARASSMACRAVFPDVIQGFVAEEELRDTAPRVTSPPIPARATAPAPEQVDTATGEILDAEVIEEESPPSTKDQWARIAKLAGTLGMKAREDKHALTVAVVGREIGSASDLTRTEADTVLAELERIAASDDPQQLAADIATGGVLL